MQCIDDINKVPNFIREEWHVPCVYHISLEHVFAIEISFSRISNLQIFEYFSLIYLNHKVMSWDLLLICRLSSLTVRSTLCQSRQAITFNVYSLYLNCSIHKVMALQPITMRSKWSSMCYVHTIEVEHLSSYSLESNFCILNYITMMILNLSMVN